MFRITARILAIFLLALAVVLAVLDITRSVTASGIVLTPFSQTLETIRPGVIADFGQTVSENLHPLLWDPVLTFIFLLPSWLVCGFLALIFLRLGRGRPHPLRRFSSR
jgi:hypothetical protein